VNREHLPFLMDPRLIPIQPQRRAMVIVKFPMIGCISVYPLLPRTLRWARHKWTRRVLDVTSPGIPGPNDIPTSIAVAEYSISWGLH